MEQWRNWGRGAWAEGRDIPGHTIEGKDMSDLQSMSWKARANAGYEECAHSPCEPLPEAFSEPSHEPSCEKKGLCEASDEHFSSHDGSHEGSSGGTTEWCTLFGVEKNVHVKVIFI